MRKHAAGCPGAGAGYKGLQSPLICGALNATQAPGSTRANPGPEDGLGGAPVAVAAPGSGPQATLPRGRHRLEGRFCAQPSVPCTRPCSATVSASIPPGKPPCTLPDATAELRAVRRWLHLVHSSIHSLPLSLRRQNLCLLILEL